MRLLNIEFFDDGIPAWFLLVDTIFDGFVLSDLKSDKPDQSVRSNLTCDLCECRLNRM